MVDERIAERRADVRRERRLRRLRRTLLVVVLLGVSLVAAIVERSSLVALAEVRVDGLERLGEADVVDAAGLALGTSTLRLDLGGAAERVEELPLVDTATVRRLDPLTVLIEVVERGPSAVVSFGQRSVLVDPDGVVIATGSEPGLPTILLQSGRLPAPGDHVSQNPAVANAHRAIQHLPGVIRARVDHYLAMSADDLDLELDDGTRVHLGRADRMDEKARALGAVLEDLDGRRVAAIDVRAPGRPVVIPAS
jgi:cell division protein FtsQ